MLAIGACVTHAQIEDGRIPDVTAGLLAHVARAIAYRAVRNRGTIGGSLAHADPAADWLTAMIALDASLELQGADGKRQHRGCAISSPARWRRPSRRGSWSRVSWCRACLRARRWGHAKYAKETG